MNTATLKRNSQRCARVIGSDFTDTASRATVFNGLDIATRHHRTRDPCGARDQGFDEISSDPVFELIDKPTNFHQPTNMLYNPSVVQKIGIVVVIVCALFNANAVSAQNTSTNEDLLTTIRQLQEQILSLQAKIANIQPQAQPAVKPVVQQTVTAELKFSRTLTQGASGDDVKQLQEFLKTLPGVYPEGRVTGYFGSLTEAAVKKFQKRNGIESVGVVGPKTRAKLVELSSGSATAAVASENVFQGISNPAVAVVATTTVATSSQMAPALTITATSSQIISASPSAIPFFK